VVAFAVVKATGFAKPKFRTTDGTAEQVNAIAFCTHCASNVCAARFHPCVYVFVNKIFSRSKKCCANQALEAYRPEFLNF
jgi:hypothetical protein